MGSVNNRVVTALWSVRRAEEAVRLIAFFLAVQTARHTFLKQGGDAAPWDSSADTPPGSPCHCVCVLLSSQAIPVSPKIRA